MTWPERGRCGACTRPAQRYPSGRWEHDGPPCALRSQTVHQVARVVDGCLSFNPSPRELLVFVPNGDDLPQPAGRRAEDIARLKRAHPDIDWRAHFAKPSEWDEVREQLRAAAERRETS